MGNTSQTIHRLRRYLDKECKQVVRYSHRSVYAGFNIDNQRRRGIQKEVILFDTLWLLQKLNKTTAGVDIKANPYLTLHEKIIILLTTNQGQTESDDEYLSRFNSRPKNMNLDGGAHLFCSPQIIFKELNQCNTTEIKLEKEIFKAMCFIVWQIKVATEIC